MAQKVDPFIHPIPKSLLNNPETRSYFEYLNRWAHDMWRRTGGSEDLIDAGGTRETYPWAEDFTEDSRDSFYSSLTANAEIDQEISYNFPIEEVKQLITKTIDNEVYTAVDNMFINATNNSTLILPKNPCENSQVDFTKDGTKLTLKGNGKKVNGTTQDIIFKKERLGRQIRYFIDVDEWFFI